METADTVLNKTVCGHGCMRRLSLNSSEEVLLMKNQVNSDRPYLLASDFDQTLSFNDSGIVLSELLGRSGFQEKVAGMAQKHLVQQGGELAYLLLHDPEYRCVRKEHLVETGKRIRLKANIELLSQVLAHGIEGQLQDWDKIRSDWLTFHEESKQSVLNEHALVN
jgi:hypothetical protein